MPRRSRQACRCCSEPCPASSWRWLRTGREPPQPRAKARSGMQPQGKDQLALPAHPRLPHRDRSGQACAPAGAPAATRHHRDHRDQADHPDHRNSQSLRSAPSVPLVFSVSNAGLQAAGGLVRLVPLIRLLWLHFMRTAQNRSQLLSVRRIPVIRVVAVVLMLSRRAHALTMPASDDASVLVSRSAESPLGSTST
jgi:hypothetical protein